MIFKGAGCKYHTNCLTCPFETCKLDLPFSGNESNSLGAYRMNKIIELRRAGQSINLVCSVLMINRKECHRLIRKHYKRTGEVFSESWYGE